MASLSPYPQFETNFMPDRTVVELLLQSKSAKAHGKSYIKVKPHLVHLLHDHLFSGNVGLVILYCCVSNYLMLLLHSRLVFLLQCLIILQLRAVRL